MESLKNKLLYEYKNKKCVYYNTEIAKQHLIFAEENLKRNLNKEQLNLFHHFKNLQTTYENEVLNEIFCFIFDYIKNKLELK